MFPMKEVIKRIKYHKWGYQTVEYIFDDSQYGGDGNLPMCAAFTWPEQPYLYIGRPKDAYHLCAKIGIKPTIIGSIKEVKPLTIPETAKKLLKNELTEVFDERICTIGFCEKKTKMV